MSAYPRTPVGTLRRQLSAARGARTRVLLYFEGGWHDFDQALALADRKVAAAQARLDAALSQEGGAVA